MKIITLIFLNHCDLNGEPIVKKMAVSRTVMARDIDFEKRQLEFNKLSESEKTELLKDWREVIGIKPYKLKNRLKTA